MIMALLQSPAFIYFLFGIACGLGLKLRRRLEQAGCMLAIFYYYGYSIGLIMLMIFHFIFKPYHFAWLLLGIFAVYALQVYDALRSLVLTIRHVAQSINYYLLLKSANSREPYRPHADSEPRTRHYKTYTWQDYKQQQHAYYQDEPDEQAQSQHKQHQSKQQSQQEQAHTQQAAEQNEQQLRLAYQQLLNLSGDQWTALALEKAWKKKRSELHPDRHHTKSPAVIAQKTLEFQKCQEAYAYLKQYITQR